ncbi:MAG: hypothetical protein V4459_14475 [Pseudomonadota bacterium]
MTRRLRLPLASLAATFIVGATGDDDPESVITRTKTTTATYASYDWMIERDEEGAANDGWAAEFNAGDWHRVENASRRVLANCRSHIGYIYDVASGETASDDTVWVGACGIYTGTQILSVDRLPGVTTKTGMVDVIRITDRQRVRYYQVDARGVILRSNWTAANGSPAPCLQGEPIARLNALPPGEIFSRASLARSVVAERYRKPPKTLPPIGLSGKSCAAVG